MARTIQKPLAVIILFIIASLPLVSRADTATSTSATSTPDTATATTTPVTTDTATTTAPTATTTPDASVSTSTPPASQNGAVGSSSPAPVVIHATVNIRYQGSLVWSGQVSLTKGTSASVVDDTGASRMIASDSALEALVQADALSPDFSLTDLAYYPDYSAFYIKCIDIAAVPTHACNDWQYVENSAYPPVGADKYTVADGDVIYFYFGDPRRVSLTSSSAEASTSVSVLTQTYDYTNNTWTPLQNAQVGATQPNPADPYSPLVPFTATSGMDGVAHLFITTPGTYGIGLAQDYYSNTETLVITPAEAQAAAVTVNQHVSPMSARSGSSAAATIAAVAAPVLGTTTAAIASSTQAVETIDAAAVALVAERVMIRLDVSIADFIARYEQALINLGIVR